MLNIIKYLAFLEIMHISLFFISRKYWFLDSFVLVKDIKCHLLQYCEMWCESLSATTGSNFSSFVNLTRLKTLLHCLKSISFGSHIELSWFLKIISCKCTASGYFLCLLLTCFYWFIQYFANRQTRLMPAPKFQVKKSCTMYLESIWGMFYRCCSATNAPNSSLISVKLANVSWMWWPT